MNEVAQGQWSDSAKIGIRSVIGCCNTIFRRNSGFKGLIYQVDARPYYCQKIKYDGIL
jgi:hypothetical protein